MIPRTIVHGENKPIENWGAPHCIYNYTYTYTYILIHIRHWFLAITWGIQSQWGPSQTGRFTQGKLRANQWTFGGSTSSKRGPARQLGKVECCAKRGFHQPKLGLKPLNMRDFFPANYGGFKHRTLGEATTMCQQHGQPGIAATGRTSRILQTCQFWYDDDDDDDDDC